jgi:hypothetical protein
MADTKISALTAAGAAADANEFAINEAGTSKKLSASLLKTYVNTAPLWAAGTSSASTWPKLTTGTKLTTPEDGAIEYQDNCIYGTGKANNRGVFQLEHWISQVNSRTLGNNTNLQKLFDSVSNGTLNLATGLYFFSCMFALTGMSATSGNALFDLKGAGSCTLTTILYNLNGVDSGNVANVGNKTGQGSTTAATAASCVTAGTGTAMIVEINGCFVVSVAGTIIPSVQQVTAAAATVLGGSYFRCHRVGTTSQASIGDWS